MTACLVIGAGQIGTALVQRLAQERTQSPLHVISVSRHARDDLNALANVQHIVKDARDLNVTDLGAHAAVIRHIVIIVTADSRQAAAYRDSYEAISKNIVLLSRDLPHLARVIFVSSSSVYGQNAGEIIDCHTPPQQPAAATAQVLLDTEQLLQHYFGEKLTIVRPSGIYGPTRRAMIRLTECLIQGDTPPPNRWTNRIFADDVVHVLFEIIHVVQPLPLYLATDQTPTDLYTVLRDIAWRYFQHELNLPDTPPLEGKRIIGNVSPWLDYPNYCVGYAAIFATAP